MLRATDIALLIKSYDYRGQTFEDGLYEISNQLGLRDDQAAHFYAYVLENAEHGGNTHFGPMEKVVARALETMPQ